MIIKWKMKKLAFLLVSGAFFSLACFSLCHAELYFSTDIPVTIGSEVSDERDITHYDSSSFSNYLTGSDLGIPDGVNLGAFNIPEKLDYCEPPKTGDIFYVDIPTTLNGETFTCRDLILYDGTDFNKCLDGSAIGIPNVACIDAATVLYDGSIVFSLDIPVDLSGTSYDANDLIQWKDSILSLYLDGSSKSIPDNADIDGVYVVPSGNIIFSLDIPAELDSLEVAEKDVIECDELSCSKYFDGTGLPMSMDMDALTLDVCEGDFECDGDVDGTNAATFKADFGRSLFNNPCTNGNQCNGDFECDSDVDGTDAAKFKSDFGRGSFNNPCIACVGVDWCVYP